MEQTANMDRLYADMKSKLIQAPLGKRETAIKTVVAALQRALKSLQPPQTELKQTLLTDKTAMRIREIWNSNKKLFDLSVLAKELELTLKKPTLDHILLGYYHPTNRLHDLLVRFERIYAADPSREKEQRFQEWRGKIRSLRSQEEMSSELGRIVEQHGAESVREFAKQLQVKDLSGKRKLPKDAKESRLIEALSTHLWSEKQTSRAQEGA